MTATRSTLLKAPLPTDPNLVTAHRAWLETLASTQPGLCLSHDGDTLILDVDATTMVPADWQDLLRQMTMTIAGLGPILALAIGEKRVTGQPPERLQVHFLSGPGAPAWIDLPPQSVRTILDTAFAGR